MESVNLREMSLFSYLFLVGVKYLEIIFHICRSTTQIESFKTFWLLGKIQIFGREDNM